MAFCRFLCSVFLVLCCLSFDLMLFLFVAFCELFPSTLPAPPALHIHPAFFCISTFVLLQETLTQNINRLQKSSDQSTTKSETHTNGFSSQRSLSTSTELHMKNPSRYPACLFVLIVESATALSCPSNIRQICFPLPCHLISQSSPFTRLPCNRILNCKASNS